MTSLTITQSETQAFSSTIGSRAHLGQSASLYQRGIWFLTQLNPAPLWITLEAEWNNPIDRSALKQSIRLLEKRHSILRSKFTRLAWGDIETEIDYETSLNLKQYEEHQAHDRPIDFSKELSISIVEPSKVSDKQILVIRLHRMIADHASALILVDDLLKIYTKIQSHQLPVLPALLSSYADYTKIQHEKLAKGAYEAGIQYWLEQLSGPRPNLDLPFDFPRISNRSTLDAICTQRLPAFNLGKLQHISGLENLSISHVMRAIYAILLYRYTGEETIRMGVVHSTRHRPEQQAVIGPLENIIVSMIECNGTYSFIDVLEALAAHAKAIEPYSNVPFEHVLDTLNSDGTLKQTMPFQVAFSCTTPANALQKRYHEWVNHIDIYADSALNADLLLEVSVTPNESEDNNRQATKLTIKQTTEQTTKPTTKQPIVNLHFHYASALFKAATIENLSQHFCFLAQQIFNNPRLKIHQFELLPQKTFQVLSAPWPHLNYPELAVQTLISQQAQRNPHHIAVVCEDHLLTYKQLDEQSNRLAHYLIHAGIQPETKIGVALERGINLIVALLGVFKSGAALLPIDPTHPAERICYMLDDANVEWVITQSHLSQTLPFNTLTSLNSTNSNTSISSLKNNVKTLMFDTFDWSRWPVSPVPHSTHPRQLAYMIYTSGSSGKPKAVAVTHGPLSLHCQATAELYGMTHDSRELHFLSMSFDGAHERWIVPLIVGGCVVLRPDVIWSPQETYEALEHHRINNAGFPTSYLQQLASCKNQNPHATPLRLLSFGGEGMSRATFEQVKQHLAPEWLINGYGPTETVISPLAWKVQNHEGFESLFAPIGRAVGPRRAYVLDKDFNPVPVGIPGELYIGGVCLGRGYYNRPAATAERFLPDPFSLNGGRMYSTGDQVRWRADGTIEFLGRLDQQIKIRGFRIELGEIEAALHTQASVQAAAAVVHTTPQGQKLVGYVIPKKGVTPNTAAIRAALAERLPDYMIPSTLMILDHLPISPNGKLDRKALPLPTLHIETCIAPTTELEKSLVNIWQKVLELEPVGITNNFFDLGGDSLSALRLISEIQTLLPNCKIQIVDIFNYPDIQQLAYALSTNRIGNSEVVHLQRTGSKPMLYCFPGLLVSTREYNQLIKHLGEDQPATGFICHSLSTPSGNYSSTYETTSVESLAQRYADYIKQHSAGKPCFLLGWSWGGILAYEAARLLSNDVDIKLVGMLDVCALDAEFAVGSEQPLDPHIRTTLQHEIDEWLTQTRMRAQWLELFERMNETVYTQFLHYVNNSPDTLPLDGPDAGSREHIFWTLMDNALVFRHYTLTPLESPIPLHAWIAEDSLLRGMNIIDWKHYANNVVKTETLPDTTHLKIVGNSRFHQSFAESILQSL
ncbi:MAG: amino acid adenylation domain-containing protein [Pseudomonadota bacterium]